MFNRRPLAIVIASALYVGAAANAAAGTSNATQADNHLQQVRMQNLASYATARTGSQTNKAQTEVRQGKPGGLNQQIRPASSRAKFVAEPARKGEDVYIVRLHDQPVATYDGRVKGYAATAKSALKAEAKSQSGWEKWLDKGKSLVGMQTSEKARVEQYKHYLNGKQQEVLQAARSKGVYNAPRLRFTDAINGFTMKLTQAQAKALAELPQVEFVQRSDLLKLHTDRGPEFIGADQVWTGMSVTGLPQQGEGMLVGIIDSGINTDHPSFADIGDDGYDHSNPLGSGNYLGDCATGVLQCNDKLIGVWSWPFITNSFEGIRPASGEDYNGHGSHTAGTVAGNVIHNAPLLGSSLGDGDGVPTGLVFDTVSGVAPHANIIAYQVCFPNGGCPDETVIKAIDQAIQDGVDVINFSIGGAERFPWEDANALAFLSAREAGISLAASAGNAGPNFYTLSHSAPWYTIVAASTTDRVLELGKKTLSLSGGGTTPPDFPTYDWTEYGGISAAGINGTLVDAVDHSDEQCLNEFAPGTFTSTEIVVCKRGGNARVQKAYNVMAGGAGGFVLVNAGYPDDDDGLVNDTYPLPGIQLHSWDGQAMLSWMHDGGAGHSADISASTITRTIDPAAGDRLADFSSRGPISTYEGSLAPHLSAPGVDIFAPYADEHPFDPNSALSRDWAAISGTSMASPHVAGTMTLVRQAHPDWTPAEVQSALIMTASETVTEQLSEWTPPRPAHTHKAGAGRVNALAAVDAGLVMDETASNFEAANPHNGGDVKQLNLPQLVNNHCRDICSWIRTVRATRDGTWTVSAGDWTYDRWNTGEGEFPQNGVKFEVFPSTFALRAGESKTLMLRADLTDAQFRSNGNDHVLNSEQIELWSKVIFTADNPAIPVAHWPISINYDHGGLPINLELTAHRDNGAYRLSNVALPAMNSVNYRGYGLVKADVETVALKQDIDHIPPQFDGDYTHSNTLTTLVNVPEGTARLVVENIQNVETVDAAPLVWQRGWATIYIGQDSNGNGLPDFDDETLCISNTEVELNYCSISHPDAGQYWVFINNVRTGLSDGEEVDYIDTYRIATAIVPNSVSSNLRVNGPGSSNGTAVDVDLNWTLSEMVAGDVAYGAFDIGSAGAPGSVGFVPVKLSRGVDDVSLTTSQTGARGGDVIDVTVHVVENTSGADRNIDLQTTLPAGLTLLPDSVSINNKRQRASLSVNGNTIRVAGTQLNSENWQREYVLTTSKTDASCKTPIYTSNYGSSRGGFVGLYKNLGLMPDFGGQADHWGTQALAVPLANFWGDGAGYALYNNQDFVSYPELLVSPQGWVIMEPYFADTMLLHHEFPYLTLPYTPMIGVMWKGGDLKFDAFGGMTGKFLGTPLNVDWFDASATSGMLMASSSSTNDLIFEWVGARTQNMEVGWWGDTNYISDEDDRYSFDLIMNPEIRHNDGQFEIMMAYGDLNFADQAGNGSIGVQGYTGPLTAFGPLYGDLATKYAYDDLKSKLSKDLVVCYDYVGPESTQFDLTFKVRVAETASGQTLPLQFVSNVTGMGQRQLVQNITVAGNLKVGDIGNQTIAENTTLSGLPVIYHDNDNGPNIISVTGAHISAKVNGNDSGDSVDITPEANFEGTTEVTVTVYDQANPTDRSSTTFMLTVTSGTNVSTSSKGGGGGGSVGIGALALLALLGRRRKARRN
ncbi:S8 family serine peptidase [Permianibacter sp. IMCC34836]|uniref:S8 family serine peptidase n=1 Tax=Permianibacter fluminis TaxID=2738515 RepID=UPI0015545930|nr:S8 family serine peptidase [Permianibacter fluminis]NQD35481.1 S8 family serine peptidase [Permianibacter fluminis]